MTSPEQGLVTQEQLTSGDVMAISQETVTYAFEPGNPESRLPLEDATEVMRRVGLGGDVMAELRLGGGSTPKVPAEKDAGHMNIWLVKGESGDFALFNADAVSQVARTGKQVEEAFMDFFATDLPANKTVIIGLENVTLGMKTVAGQSREDVDFISRAHVKVSILEDPSKPGVQIEVQDVSSNGTTLQRGSKEQSVGSTENQQPELITEIPGIPHKNYGRSDEIHSGDVVPHTTGRKRVPVENPGASALAAANFRLPKGHELGIGEDGKFEPVRIDRHEE